MKNEYSQVDLLIVSPLILIWQSLLFKLDRVPTSCQKVSSGTLALLAIGMERGGYHSLQTWLLPLIWSISGTFMEQHRQCALKFLVNSWWHWILHCCNWHNSSKNSSLSSSYFMSAVMTLDTVSDMTISLKLTTFCSLWFFKMGSEFKDKNLFANFRAAICLKFTSKYMIYLKHLEIAS